MTYDTYDVLMSLIVAVAVAVDLAVLWLLLVVTQTGDETDA